MLFLGNPGAENPSALAALIPFSATRRRPTQSAGRPSSSKDQLQRELRDAWIIGVIGILGRRARDLSEVRRGGGCAGVAKVRVVQQIEVLRAELKITVFFDREASSQAGVPVS